MLRDLYIIIDRIRKCIGFGKMSLSTKGLRYAYITPCSSEKAYGGRSLL